MPAEMSLVDFVFQTLINCGKSAIVVKAAAIKPIIVIVSIIVLPYSLNAVSITFVCKNKMRKKKALTLIDVLDKFSKFLFSQV